MLGTDAANDQALPLGPFAVAAEKTRERARKACALARAALQIIHRPPPAGGKQVAWRICRNVITHALDYDSRVLTSSLVLPHAALVERSAWEIVRAIIGSDLSEAVKDQIQLPTALAGCQMPMPTELVPLARAADLMETGHILRTTVTGWGYDLAIARQVDGVDAAVEDGLFGLLRDRGIVFAAPGRPQQRGDARDALVTPDALRPASPSRHMLSTMLRASASAKHSALALDVCQRNRTRIRCSGGQNAGKSLIAPAGLQATHFNDEEFVEVLRWRLGFANSGGVCVCRIAAKNMTEGGEALDIFGDHAATCSFGPLRIKRHDNIAGLSDIIAETGAHVWRKAYVQAFCTPAHEAWLDVWAFAGLRVQDLLVDVTVRHPMSSAYQPAAASTDGVAAEEAEAQKVKRYPPAGGRVVIPFAMETWGRLGPQTEHLLQFLAAEATLHHRRCGQDVTAGSFLRRWRATLDAIILKSVALSLMAARCGLPGRPHQRDWQGKGRGLAK